MRVLDLDLDFFLSDIEHWRAETDNRLGLDSGIDPWSPLEVQAFLENQCLLRQDEPLPGARVTRHVEVYDVWRRLIEERKLDTPFDVVHVDAHADLGLGSAAYVYLMTDWLSRPVEERADPDRGGLTGLDSTTFLVFAIACRWIRTLTYVHHPHGGNDVMMVHVKDHDLSNGVLQLEYCGDVGSTEIVNRQYKVISSEPEVPFTIVPGPAYQATEPFDFVFLAQSPSYTPASADPLMDLMERYILQ